MGGISQHPADYTEVLSRACHPAGGGDRNIGRAYGVDTPAAVGPSHRGKSSV